MRKEEPFFGCKKFEFIACRIPPLKLLLFGHKYSAIEGRYTVTAYYYRDCWYITEYKGIGYD